MRGWTFYDSSGRRKLSAAGPVGGAEHNILSTTHPDTLTTPVPEAGDSLSFDGADWVADEPSLVVNRTAYRWGEEFLHKIAATEGNFARTRVIAVAGGGNISNIPPEASHPGIVRMETNASSTARTMAAVGDVNSVLFGSGRVRVTFWIRTSTNLSDGTDRYTYRIGFNATSDMDSADAIMFRYVDNVNSGKWQAVTRNDTVETSTDTGITVAANTWYRLEIDINSAATSVIFKIDGTTVATVATNIPSGAGDESQVMAVITKSLGTAMRYLDIDAIKFTMNFATAR